jgi:hypothetical protein
VKQKQEHKMIIEELLNIIWFRCSKKNIPDSGTGAQETRHLNGEEDRTNTGNLI